jgi:hypothetical protein
MQKYNKLRFGYILILFWVFLHECHAEPTQTANEAQMEVYFLAEKILSYK